MVILLDGEDKYRPTFEEKAVQLLKVRDLPAIWLKDQTLRSDF